MNLFATALKPPQMYSAAAVEFALPPRRAWRSEAEQVKVAMVDNSDGNRRKKGYTLFSNLFLR